MFHVHILVVQKDLSMSNHITNVWPVRGLWMIAVVVKLFNVSFLLNMINQFKDKKVF
jgi:hypothetical protein